MSPSESPALAEYTLLLATTQTNTHEPTLPILENPKYYLQVYLIYNLFLQFKGINSPLTRKLTLMMFL